MSLLLIEKNEIEKIQKEFKILAEKTTAATSTQKTNTVKKEELVLEECAL